jgi:hypothetical protein
MAQYLIGDNRTHPTYDVYVLRVGRMETRHGRKYGWSSCKEGTHPSTHFASATMISRSCAEMHSCAPFPVYTKPPTSFLEVLHSYKDCGMWDHLSVDSDGEWIQEGIAMGSVVVAHGGSYMATKAPDLCSAGVVLFCRMTRKWYGARVGGPKYYAVNLILRLFLYHFFTYVELVTSRVHLQQHKQPTNTTTMVMELLATPAAWFQWIHTVREAGGLAHVRSEAAVEGFW